MEDNFTDDRYFDWEIHKNEYKSIVLLVMATDIPHIP